MADGFVFDDVLIPSGSFLHLAKDDLVVRPVMPLGYYDEASPLDCHTIQICNPMAKHEPQQVVIKELTNTFNAEFFKSQPEEHYIGVDELKSYASQLLEIGKAIAGAGYDAVLIPLRGGLKPWVQLDVMSQYQHRKVWVPYTAGSSGRYDEQITASLISGLNDLLERPKLRLAVIDAANGGQGSLHLTELIAAVHAHEPKREWITEFHLLYSTREFPKQARRIPDQSNETCVFTTQFWRVPDLIVEDWNEAIGLSVKWRDGLSATIKKSATAGRVWVAQSNGAVRLIESSELDKLVDSLVANAITERVLNDPLLRFQGDVWDRYKEK